MALREAQMLERKSRILDTAEKLIRTTGNTDFSVRDLAAAAAVSPATPFNLFGSKEGIFYELLLRTLEKVTASTLPYKSEETGFYAMEAAENAVNFFLEDPEFLRPLYQVLLGVSHPEHRKTFMNGTYEYWGKTASSLIKPSDRKDEKLCNAVTISLMAHFIGVLELWVQNDLDDKSFKLASKVGILSILQPFVSTKSKKEMQSTFSELKDELPLLRNHVFD